MAIKNPTLRRRTKELTECAEDARESRLLGHELENVGNLIIAITMHMTDLQNKVDGQAEHIKMLNEKSIAQIEHIKMLNKKLEQTPTDRPRGHWIVIDEYSVCSVCDAEIDWYDLPYCPFCGADMKGATNDERRSGKVAVKSKE